MKDKEQINIIALQINFYHSITTKTKNMKRTYDLGIDTNQIEFEVKVGTVGTAFTSTTLMRSGGQHSQLAESNEDSGNIPKFVRTAAELRTSYFIVRTIIDFSNIEKDQWENQKDKLIIRYFINSGFSGFQVYNQDMDDILASPSGKLIVITKAIELK